MFENKWRYLQLFAEGAPAGDGGAASGGAGGAAATGVNASAAGEQELLALGVPKGRISKRASAAVAQKMGKDGARVEKSTQQAAAAAVTEEGNTKEGAAATGWQIPEGLTAEEIIKNPAVNKIVQGIVSKRVNDTKGAAEAMEAMKPMFEVLARQYGMDPGKLDYAKLSQAVEGDNRYYEDMAIANGVDVDTARQMDRDNRENQRQQEQLRQERMQQQVQAWRQEEAQLNAQGVKINLNEESKNPTFVNLLRAGFGVKGAYEAVHHAEIVEATKQAAFQQAQTQTVSQIRSGNYRPAELGSSQAPAAAPNQKLSRNQMQSIRARLDRGETVDPREFGIF